MSWSVGVAAAKVPGKPAAVDGGPSDCGADPNENAFVSPYNKLAKWVRELETKGLFEVGFG